MRTPLAALLLALATPAQSPDCLLDPTPYRAVVRQDDATVVLDNGLLRLTVQRRPFALVGLELLQPTPQQLLRATAPLGEFTVDGEVLRCGGLVGQPNRAFLLPQWLADLQPDPLAIAAEVEVAPAQPIAERMPWRRTRHAARDAAWPPPGQHVAFRLDRGDLVATVHLELYDGLPLFAHWLELQNTGDRPRELERFVSLRLPIVEAESRVEPERSDVRLPNLYVETDFAFHAMCGADGSSHCVRWTTDPEFGTQVNYQKQTRCVLEVAPELGPAQTLAPDASFATFRSFVLVPDRDERQRTDLLMRRMYRTIAPWSTENPLMMHVRSAADDAVKLAIEQCAAVGFEMLILTFGSGFDVEDASQQNLDRWKAMADLAHEKGIQLGGYSLLSSRRIQPDGDNCIDLATGKPGGQVFGFAPALASDWGQRYFAQLYRFYEYTGFDLLEHDGSYPGDPDAAARPPLQKGWQDSRQVQYRILADFYRWCRARGVYLNVPDWYFLQGSSKTGMGYRETNWSLPREQQVIHARQNLFDGTRQKTPSMGWMFVPLTEYHGGGAAATVEPLDEHLDHYAAMLWSNLGYGAQACYRGPRLYDTERTREVVVEAVRWFQAHRDVLEGDVIHSSSRRADGRDLDWVLHVDPRGPEPAMLVVFNPTGEARQKAIPLDLYYAGLEGRVVATGADGAAHELQLDRFSRGRLEVEVPASGRGWWVLQPVR
ncbi:MAG: alpha-galactosidase [Planctomycetota bacterium]